MYIKTEQNYFFKLLLFKFILINISASTDSGTQTFWVSDPNPFDSLLRVKQEYVVL